VSSPDKKIEVISCNNLIQFSFFTLGWMKPQFLAQGTAIDLQFEGAPKNSFQIDGEHFKHVGGRARVRVEWRSHVNMLRYLG